MGLATLQIWITSESDPCKISELNQYGTSPWVVGIWHCDGGILKWCEKTYFRMPAKCGYLEVKVPPGKYVIRAASSMYSTASENSTAIWGNHWSDHAVVTVCCDDCTCVTLFSPTAHNCGWGFLNAVKHLMAAKMLPEDIGAPAVKAIETILKKLPESNWIKMARKDMERLGTDEKGQKNK